MTTVNKLPDFMVSDDDEFDPYEQASFAISFMEAQRLLNLLSKTRADDPDKALRVGMALKPYGKDGLLLWEAWLKQSAKYEPGFCAQKWPTLSKAWRDAEGITPNSLSQWAQADGYIPFVRPCPKNAKPSDYEKALAALGYKFSLNEMNDEISVNGVRLTDPLEARIINSLAEHGYKSEQIARRCMMAMGLDNQFHPIRDYLKSIKWDGVDHIGQLATFFHDKDGIFPVLLRRWLIGAVGRILRPDKAIQNPVLVLDGPQGIGKSQFTWWLGSPLPAYYLQSSITAGDKDSLIRLCSTFVWELGELGATFRRSDIESLKQFISMLWVKVRAAYGRRDMHKPATASFIGTINNVAGFLADPTGNRRYRSCTLTSIDWDYDKHINVNQVWAEAVALFLMGETNELDSATQAIANKINQNYEVDEPLAYAIYSLFNVDPKQTNMTIPTAEIIKALRNNNDVVGGDDRLIGQRIASVLVKAGCEYGRIYINKQQVRGWKGVWKI